MSASWYDVLGVAPDAGEGEIRSAWRTSIEDLDPTDRRFALYNEAAGVLLDRDRRSAYDAELAAASQAPEPMAAEVPEATPEPAAEPVPADEDRSTVAEARRTEVPAPKTARTSKRSVPDVPTWLLAALGLAIAVVAVVAFLVQRGSEDGADVESALSDARQAAETSVPKVFTYDYRFPDRDRDQGARVLTGELKADYEQLWEEAITPNLVATQGTAQSEVVATGEVTGSEERAEVLVVLNSVTGNKNQKQQLTLALTVSLVQEDGRWLIEQMDGWDPDEVTAGDEGPESPDPSASPTTSPEPSPTE